MADRKPPLRPEYRRAERHPTNEEQVRINAANPGNHSGEYYIEPDAEDLPGYVEAYGMGDTIEYIDQTDIPDPQSEDWVIDENTGRLVRDTSQPPPTGTKAQRHEPGRTRVPGKQAEQEWMPDDPPFDVITDVNDDGTYDVREQYQHHSTPPVRLSESQMDQAAADYNRMINDRVKAMSWVNEESGGPLVRPPKQGRLIALRRKWLKKAYQPGKPTSHIGRHAGVGKDGQPTWWDGPGNMPSEYRVSTYDENGHYSGSTNFTDLETAKQTLENLRKQGHNVSNEVTGDDWNTEYAVEPADEDEKSFGRKAVLRSDDSGGHGFTDAELAQTYLTPKQAQQAYQEGIDLAIENERRGAPEDYGFSESATQVRPEHKTPLHGMAVARARGYNAQRGRMQGKNIGQKSRRTPNQGDRVVNLNNGARGQITGFTEDDPLGMATYQSSHDGRTYSVRARDLYDLKNGVRYDLSPAPEEGEDEPPHQFRPDNAPPIDSEKKKSFRTVRVRQVPGGRQVDVLTPKGERISNHSSEGDPLSREEATRFAEDYIRRANRSGLRVDVDDDKKALINQRQKARVRRYVVRDSDKMDTDHYNYGAKFPVRIDEYDEDTVTGRRDRIDTAGYQDAEYARDRAMGDAVWAEERLTARSPDHEPGTEAYLEDVHLEDHTKFLPRQGQKARVVRAPGSGPSSAKFTGTVKDSQGRTICFRNGKRTPCPKKAKEPEKPDDRMPQEEEEGLPAERRGSGVDSSPLMMGGPVARLAPGVMVEPGAIECEWYVSGGVLRCYSLATLPSFSNMNRALRDGVELDPTQQIIHARLQRMFQAVLGGNELPEGEMQ